MSRFASIRTLVSAALPALALAVATAAPANDIGAQAWAYPAFQQPRVTNREFNFAVTDAGNSGTALLFQWREGTGPRTQLSFDAGFADPEGKSADPIVFVGGQFAYQLGTASADMPLDFLFTAGGNVAFGDVNVFRIPVGVSLGHRFPLEGGLAITPWVHPRLSIDVCGGCGDDNNADLGVVFDIGTRFEITRALALKLAATFGGSDLFEEDGFGLSLAWTPPGLNRLRGR